MIFKIFTAVILLGLTLDVAFAFVPQERVDQQQQQFLQLLKRAYRIDENEMNLCFEYYLPEQTDIYNEYQRLYSRCLSTANDAKKKLDQQAERNRTYMIGRGQNICNQMNTCEQLQGLEFFECYTKTCNANSGVLYKISEDSTIEKNILQRKHQVIESERNDCTGTCRTVYIARMAKSNQELEDCLNGKHVPTQWPPTPTTEDYPKPTTQDDSTPDWNTTLADARTPPRRIN